MGSEEGRGSGHELILWRESNSDLLDETKVRETKHTSITER